MQTKVVIENGEVKHDVLDGKGEACRKGTDPYMKALREEFGLPAEGIVEDCKPEMQQVEQQTDKLEGDKLA